MEEFEDKVCLSSNITWECRLTVNKEPAICGLSREVAAKRFRSALEQIVQETKHLRGIYMATLSFFFVFFNNTQLYTMPNTD